MERNANLLNYYTISLNFLCCIAILIPYFENHIGLSFQDFLIAEAFFAFVIVALEVPSGWLSDVWRRKSVLMLAAITYILGMAMLVIADSFTDAFIAQGILGVAVSLFSGTNSAFLYDSLLAQGKENEFSKREGRRVAVGLYSFAVGSIVGGFLYSLNPHYPFYVEIIACMPALYFAYKMVEPPRAKSAVNSNPFKDMALTMKYALHGHKEIAFIIIFAAVLFSGTKLLMWSQQPYYMALEIPEYYFGILMAVGAGLGGLSSQLGHRIDGRISNIRMLTIIFIVVLIVCAISGYFVSYLGVGLLMIAGSCAYGLSNPRVDNAINSRVSSERRATILSTKSLLIQLFFIPSGLFIGYLTETEGGIRYGLYGVIGWLMLGGLCIALWEINKHRKRTM